MAAAQQRFDSTIQESMAALLNVASTDKVSRHGHHHSSFADSHLSFSAAFPGACGEKTSTPFVTL